MRVLHIFTNSHLTNGASVFEYRISQKLKKCGIFFDYLVTEPPTAEERERYENEQSIIYELPIDNKHGLLVREIKINIQYYKFFKKNDYDFVYADTENGLRAIHLLMARFAGVKVRVVHSHNSCLQTSSKTSRILSRLLRHVFWFSATDYFACSDLAAEWLFPRKVYKKHLYKILKNGIDLSQFTYNEEVRKSIRDCYGIRNEFVVGNVGRFMPQKNHSFLIDIFVEILKVVPDARLMLIGTGPLEDEIKAKVEENKIEDYVIFVGNVSNVNEYLQAMDVYLMPSLFEGLPITGIEAQASGLPCFFSDSITDELSITSLVHHCALEASSVKWAEAIVKYRGLGRKNVKNEITKAGYSINATVDELRRFYFEKNK
ncbi:MAG: glycosyltransferase family 1 protein [Oscillospiraceae bacterium]|nr:glycosyltransferase family 1 protein [Oscillospiraceae bacterium]